MECTIKWLDGMSFVAETGSGHLLAMDGAPEAGGRNLAPRPMELMLAGAGGCTAFDVVLILKRGRHDIRGCSVRLEAERADTDPKVFTRVRFIYTLSGRKLKRDAVERAIRVEYIRRALPMPYAMAGQPPTAWRPCASGRNKRERSTFWSPTWSCPTA